MACAELDLNVTLGGDDEEGAYGGPGERGAQAVVQGHGRVRELACVSGCVAIVDGG